MNCVLLQGLIFPPNLPEVYDSEFCDVTGNINFQIKESCMTVSCIFTVDFFPQVYEKCVTASCAFLSFCDRGCFCHRGCFCLFVTGDVFLFVTGDVFADI